ncbi:winged helix-turn-helix transcriptional regulator [Nonomuraea sp. PA05]|nr:winged helix-turn-helix transcriptional regulator [Nonomuraea sp. PA05]
MPIAVQQSPLAELCACLHALDEPGHHPLSAGWVARAHARLDAGLLATAAAWAPLYGAFRARYLLPLSAGRRRTLDDELGEVAELPIGDFVAMTVQALIGVNETELAPRLSDETLHRLRLISSSRQEIGGRLRADPHAVRARLLDFLAAFARAAFAAEWPALRRTLDHDGALRERDLRRRGALTLSGLPTATAGTPSGRRLHVVFDKLYNATARVTAARPCLLVPTVHGRPHFVIKHYPGYPVVIQYSADAAETPSLDTARRRLAALQDPTRLRLCHAILRNPVATSELANQLGMTAPQVSRHLRRLREAGLVHTHRRGPVVYYQLDADAVQRLGPDLLSILYH